MSDVWRICVIEGDISLNQSLVNSLRKDGYAVQGAVNSADAMRNLWSEEYDVVICSLNLPGADGLELLRWLRAYRSNVRPIVLGNANETEDSNLRLQALESGAVSYIEKPIDLRLLKDELRRLLQQTGFTASLDSFDLLDVIQIITMSHKSITLLVNIGLEERGTLRFQQGELVWAEYGLLRGEEAFFALAAHKNGTVTQQLSDDQFVTNVTQPLSRLIFQALQYRTKYANDYVGELEAPFSSPSQPTPAINSSPLAPFIPTEIDDSPFIFTSEGIVSVTPDANQQMSHVVQPTPVFPLAQEANPPLVQFEVRPTSQKSEKEWWELSGQTTIVGEGSMVEDVEAAPTFTMDLQEIRGAMNTAQDSLMQEDRNMLEEQPAQLPSWLTDQPTSSRIPVQAPTHFSSTSIPEPATSKSASGASGEMRSLQAMQSAQIPSKITDDLAGSQSSSAYMQAFAPETEERRPSSPQWSSAQKQSSAPQNRSLGQSGVFETASGRPDRSYDVDPLDMPSNEAPYSEAITYHTADVLPDGNFNNAMQSSITPQAQRQVTRKNYTALVSALQTLGYSIPGFIAAAVVDVDNQPIAQVAIDDADISQMWRLLSVVQRSALAALQADEWGEYEETVMTTASRHVLIRSIGSDERAFLVLITTREASFTDSLEIMANVEGAISAALR